MPSRCSYAPLQPRIDDADQVNVGAKVTQHPLGRVWSGRLSRSAEFAYISTNRGGKSPPRADRASCDPLQYFC
jgi:hypothetical protein